MVFSILRIVWVMPNSIKEADGSWCTWEVGKSIKTVWEMVLAAILWSIWNEWNHWCLDGISTPTQVLKAKCVLFLFSWPKQAHITSCVQFLVCVCSLVIVYLFYVYEQALYSSLVIFVCIFCMPLMNYPYFIKKESMKTCHCTCSCQELFAVIFSAIPLHVSLFFGDWVSGL